MHQVRSLILGIPVSMQSEFWNTHDIQLETMQDKTYIRVAACAGGIGCGLMRNGGAKKEFVGLVLEAFEHEITNLVNQIIEGKSVDKIDVNKMDTNIKDLLLKLTGGTRSSHFFRQYEDLHKKLVTARDLVQVLSPIQLQVPA